MTRYEIERELDSLYKDLNIAHNADEQTVCRVFNTDTKNEAIRATTMNQPLKNMTSPMMTAWTTMPCAGYKG